MPGEYVGHELKGNISGNLNLVNHLIFNITKINYICPSQKQRKFLLICRNHKVNVT